NRATNGLGQSGDKRFDQHELAAKSTTYRHWHDVHGSHRQPERVRDLLPAVECALGTRIDREILHSLRDSECDLGLEVSLMHSQRVE
ncbi:MAG: hypothetical protein ABIY38_08590, partial [Rhodococcus sp. (in: high G+C Gram-positive bacteria)]